MINTLEKGDLIGVAYNNYIHAAIYIGEGRAKNPQFYRLNTDLIEWLERGQIPYASFINREARMDFYGCCPIVKVSVDCLPEEQQKLYVKIKDLLIKNRRL